MMVFLLLFRSGLLNLINWYEATLLFYIYLKGN